MQTLIVYGTPCQEQTPPEIEGLTVQYDSVIELGTPHAKKQQLLLNQHLLLELEYHTGEKRWFSGKDFLEQEGIVQQLAQTQLSPFKLLRVLRIQLNKPESLLVLLARLERKHQPETGLFNCANTQRLQLVSDFVLPKQSQASLLLLHGIASSVTQSFAPLWQQPDQLHRLFAPYGGQVYAYQYRSLSKTLISHALQLVKQLPKKARLHILAQGSGALLAELLCQASEQQIDSIEYKHLTQKGLGKQAQVLEQLCQLCKEKQLHIEKVVQLGAPMRGLALASQNVSDIASLIYNRSPESKQHAQALLFTLHATQQTSIQLAGLQELRPNSPLVRLLNRPNITLKQTQVASIMGVMDDANNPTWLRQYFSQQHDGFVNLASMQGSTQYRKGYYTYTLQDKQSLHYHYLSHTASLERLISALTHIETDNRWQRQVQYKAQAETVRSIQPEETSLPTTQAQGVVIFLGGLFSSHLSLAGTPVWLDMESLSWGDFTSIGIKNSNVHVNGLIKADYQSFFQHLEQSHELIPFAYDWRQSHQKAVEQLAQVLREQLDKQVNSGQSYPIRILTHSSGGLLALGLIQKYPLLWQQLCDDARARLVFVGTPLTGSGSILQLLKGEHRLVKMLDLLEGKQDNNDLITAKFREFKGVVELLPESWLLASMWETGDTNFITRIEQAQAWRQSLFDVNYDPQHMVYIRGEADLTPVQPDQDEGWKASRQGDSVVCWHDIPAELSQWHLPVEHGAMLSVPRYFIALSELLDYGHTAHLQQYARHQLKRDQLVRMRTWQEAEVFPNEQDIRAAALGYFTHTTRSETLPPISIHVAHGNLEHTNRVLMAGHYRGDSILNAEAALDQRLEGRLREVHRLGVYPGELNTSEVFLNPNKQPAGVIIIGLGEVGSLSINGLMQSVTQGLLRYAMTQREALEQQAKTTSKDEMYLPIELSTLLMGTLGSGLSLQESLLAILRATQRANQSLRQLREHGFLRITSIEVVELYEDKAIEAVRILRNLQQHTEFRDDFALNSWMQRLAGGYSRVMYNEPEGWWQRLQITAGEQGLRFLSLTDRARAESVLLATQRNLVDRFVNKAMNEINSNQCDIGKVLFEMLLPRALKEQAPSTDNLVLVLDSDAAAYPWELMHNQRDADATPLAVRIGLMRQLQTTRFRETVINTAQRSALVIGDPAITVFKRLPAAQQEARSVVSTLQQYGFDQVRTAIDASTNDILQALHEQDYRVLHLAGHGVYRHKASDGKLVTGMIIGDDAFLTAVEVQQMRKVPELVFVNCCHLGQVDDDLDDHLIQATQTERHQFAASLAEGLINMGVRAVIVAGWAINDVAAQCFAETCYQALLSGAPLGAAVLRARRNTWKRHSGNNTWGAYQCYGDPEYRLVKDAHDYEKVDNPKNIQFLAEVEVTTRLNNLINAADSGRLGEYDWVSQAINELHAAIPTEWLKRADIQSALGRAYGKLDQYQAAITAYKTALQAEHAHYSVSMLEDLISIQTAYALHLHMHENQAQAAQDLMQEAKQTLQWLEQMGQVINPVAGTLLGATNGQTLQRLEEQGKYWKRLSMMSDGDERRHALNEMEQAYRKAHEFSQEYLRRISPYPLLNKLTCQVVRYLRTEWLFDEQGKQSLLTDLQRAQTKAEQDDRDRPIFCSAIALAESALLHYLLKLEGYTIKQVSQLYQRALKRGAPPRQFRFVAEHLHFVVLNLEGELEQREDQQRLQAVQQCLNSFLSRAKPEQKEPT